MRNTNPSDDHDSEHDANIAATQHLLLQDRTVLEDRRLCLDMITAQTTNDSRGTGPDQRYIPRAPHNAQPHPTTTRQQPSLRTDSQGYDPISTGQSSACIDQSPRNATHQTELPNTPKKAETTGSLAADDIDADDIATSISTDSVSARLSHDSEDVPPARSQDKETGCACDVQADDEVREKLSSPDGQAEAVMDCLTCGETYEKSQIYHTPCGHNLCQYCIKGRFVAATRDVSSYPVSCCQPLPFDEVEACLPDDLVELYLSKKEEWDTPHRHYCRVCQEWVLPANVKDREIICPHCWAQTCLVCLARLHPGANCPPTENDH
ncbi:Hypothetical protein D9617_9g025750 [Elsinoe fawcettii]|nr:Hypothetical protein D9617_9g025750 [Elsinoe fawcettii]